jgi:hypothetical protein
VLRQAGGTYVIEIRGFDGRAISAMTDRPDVAAFDWCTANRMIVYRNNGTTTRVIELALSADHRVTGRVTRGELSAFPLDIYASAHRVLALHFEREYVNLVAPLGGGPAVPVDHGSWRVWGDGWLDDQQVVASGQLIDRAGVVALSDGVLRVLVAGIGGRTSHIDGDRVIVTRDAIYPECGLYEVRGGIIARTLPIACVQDPMTTCASLTSAPCMVSTLVDQHRVFRWFDPAAFELGATAFIDDRLDVEVPRFPALSAGGRYLAIPRPTGGVTVVELATSRRLELLADVGDGYQFASFIPGRDSVLVTAQGFGGKSRVIELGFDGSRTTHMESTDYLGFLHVAPDARRFSVTRLKITASPVIIELDN